MQKKCEYIPNSEMVSKMDKENKKNKASKVCYVSGMHIILRIITCKLET